MSRMPRTARSGARGGAPGPAGAWLSAAAAAAVTAALVPPVRRLATRLGVVDHPGPLKPQATPTPYLGGLAVAAGATVGVARARPAALVPMGMALALGVTDDARPLPPAVRLAGTVATGAALGRLVPGWLPAGRRRAATLGRLLPVATTVVLVNGCNLIDGLDGLAGGVGLAAATGLAVLLPPARRPAATALAGALAGFLVHNRPPAAIFLGDGGSYLVGVTLAALLSEAWSDAHDRPSPAVAAVLPVAVPAAEVAVALVRRHRAGLGLLAGDRGHPYDRLVARGWAPGRAAAAYAAATGALAASAVGASRLSPAAATLATATAIGALAAVVAGAGFLRPEAGR